MEDTYSSLLELLSQAIENDLPSDLNPNTDLYDAGVLDSMSTIVFIALVEEAFSIDIPPELLISSQTRNLGDLSKVIGKQIR